MGDEKTCDRLPDGRRENMWFPGWYESISTALRSRRLEYTSERGGESEMRWPPHDPEASSQQPSVPQTRPWCIERRNALNHGMVEFEEYMAVEIEASHTSPEEKPTLCLREGQPDERRPSQVAGDVNTEKFERAYLFHLGTVYCQWWDWSLFPAEIDHCLLSFRHVQFEVVLIATRHHFVDPVAVVAPIFATNIIIRISKSSLRTQTAILSSVMVQRISAEIIIFDVSFFHGSSGQNTHY